MKRLNVSVDDELHKQLKITAIEQDTTISQFVIDAIVEKIENDKKKN